MRTAGTPIAGGRACVDPESQQEPTMKYMCLIYVDESEIDDVPDDTLQRIAHEGEQHARDRRASGRLVARGCLESVQTATTVHTRNGRVRVSDGPFADTREQLAGFVLIDARDLNDAIRIASHIPAGRLGCIEVRPVRPSPPAGSGHSS
jgi:hypothetical protein